MYANIEKSDIAVDIEIESMRSLNEKVFRKLDGSFEVSIATVLTQRLDFIS